MAAKQELVDKSFRKHSQMKESGKWEADLLQHTDEDLTWEQLTTVAWIGMRTKISAAMTQYLSSKTESSNSKPW